MLFFFFKHKTAYEMRISDWSSDVCSSDLAGLSPGRAEGRGHAAAGARAHRDAAGRGGSADGAPRRRRVSVRRPDRKSVVEGKSVAVSVDLGGRRIIKNKNTTTKQKSTQHKTKNHTNNDNTIRD